MSEISRWYPTRIDGWIAALLVVGPVICIAATIATLISGGGGVFVAIGGTLLLLALYLGLVFPMRYGIDEQSVVVRHGLVRQRIPLTDIVEVHPTRSPLSSPALSLDRLQIRFGQGFFRSAMISPADKDGFLAELAAKAGLERRGERLVRATSSPA